MLVYRLQSWPNIELMFVLSGIHNQRLSIDNIGYWEHPVDTWAKYVALLAYESIWHAKFWSLFCLTVVYLKVRLRKSL